MPIRSPGQEINAIYRTVPIGLCVVDRDLRILRLNNQLAAISGRPAPDLIDRHFGDLHSEFADTIVPVLKRVIERGEPIRHEEVLGPNRSEGRSRAFVVHAEPLRDPEGQVCGVNVAIDDITERMSAETRLQTLEHRLWLQTENSPLAVIEWNRDYQVTRWGGTAEAMFGWRAEDVIGRRIDELNIVVEDDWPVVRETMRKLSAARGRHVVSSNRNYTRDGRVIACEWYNSIVTDRDGGLASVLSLVLDVTERRQMAEERRRLLEAVQQSNRIKDQFLATLAHELRQPLGALSTAVGILRLSPDSEASERALRVAGRQLEFFARIIDDLSDLSRIERGKIALARDRLDLCQVLQAAIDVNEHLFHSRAQRLDRTLPDQPLPIEGDPARLQQVFSNLLDNASKFTPRGGTIHVNASAEQDRVAVTVRDQGRGISPDQLSIIFEPFAQGEHRVGEGLGIGLAVVRQLVELHHGNVTAASAGENCGSEFVVTLPLLRSEQQAVTAEIV